MEYFNRIQAARKAAKMSQTDVANQLGKTQPTISGWEKGDYPPDVRDILGMCELFSVTPNALLGIDDNAQSTTVVVQDMDTPYLASSYGGKVKLTPAEENYLLVQLSQVRGESNPPAPEASHDTNEESAGTA